MGEATEILRECAVSIKDNYPQVRNELQVDYEWHNLDLVRREIALCIALGLPQAAIALTNHLLERLLKESLIVHHSKQARPAGEDEDAAEALKRITAEARKRFEGKTLRITTSELLKTGLISNEQAAVLKHYRENVRDPYSHADRSKIFRGVTVPVEPVSRHGDEIVVGERRIMNASDLTVGQGHLQIYLARKDALSYFTYVDRLARELRGKVFRDSSPEDFGLGET